MLMTTGPWVWVAGVLTLAIYSFLYKDNPFYKIAEYIFVGISAGYWAVFLWWNYAYPNLFVPLGEGNYWNIIPIILGFMMFTQLSKKSSWPIPLSPPRALIIPRRSRRSSFPEPWKSLTRSGKNG